MELLDDSPINNRNDDTLDRGVYAEHIAKGILKRRSKESFCIALQGSWGSGKTSLINMCLEIIEEQTSNLDGKDKPIIVRFQPWIISGHERLIKTFISELRKALKKPDLSEYARKAAKALEKYEKLLSFVSLLPVPGAAYIGKIIGILKSFFLRYAKNIENDLESHKQKICDALKELQSPILVIIDDVDRLTGEEIRQLFQLIKAVADFPNTIYLLAFDRLLIEKALESFQYGSKTRYLEKIVQLEFEVPNPSRSKLTSELRSGINDMIKNIPSEKNERKRWDKVIYGPLPVLFRNIRDIKRFLNSANFIYPIVQNEVSSVDVLIVEAIHVFAPDLYKIIRDNKEYLCLNLDPTIESSHNNEKDEWIKKFREMTLLQFSKEIKELIILLFPAIDSDFHRDSRSDGFWEIWENNKRVCFYSYFEFYFKGTVAEGEISSKEMDNIIKELVGYNNLVLILKNYMNDGRMNKLLSKIENYFKQNKNRQSACNFISAVFEVGNSIPSKPIGTSDMVYPLYLHINKTLYFILKIFDASERKKLLNDAIVQTENAALFLIGFIRYISLKDNNKPTEERLLTQTDTDEIRDIVLKLVRERSKSEILHKTPYLLSFLDDWAHLSNLDEVKLLVAGIISDEKKIPEFLGACGDPSASSIDFKINLKTLELFCDITRLKSICEKILKDSPDWLTDDYREILTIFIKSFEK